MDSSRRLFLATGAMLAGFPRLRAGAQSPGSLENRLLAELEKLEIADTHEHFFDEHDRVASQFDLFALMIQGYVGGAMSAAGLAGVAARLFRDERASAAERWKACEPYWNHVRFTGPGQVLRLTIRDLYGIEKIEASTIPRINQALQASNKTGVYRHILRERTRVRFAVVDDMCGGCNTMGSTKENFSLFLLARRFDHFIVPSTPADIQKLEAATGASITGLRGLKTAVEKNFQKNLDQGMTVVKVALAYFRDLHFEDVQEAEAERDLAELLRGKHPLPERWRAAFVRPFRKLEDHMFHHVMRLADAHRLPVQIHTGMFAGPGYIPNSNPTHLTNTFFLYPRIQFCLFHMSFPYQEELAALIRSFANVNADLNWAYILSPTGARRALEQFLDTAPLNKILGFGGDSKNPEMTYGHAKLARQTLAQVLAAKVERGFCSEEEAVNIGRLILYENAARVYRWRGAGGSG
jgi:predicted TIM-barrel fold metal-dependent hydrolase